jgi:glycosyltransferase involved in cell wall biosynthesis
MLMRGAYCMTIKILHIGKYYPPHMGGIEIYLQQLVSRQSQTLDVSVVVANDSGRTESELRDGARITRVGCFGTFASMPITPGLAWVVRQSKPNILHLHTPNPGGALAAIVNGFEEKLIITHHADTLGRRTLRRFADPMVRQAMKRASAIIVTSRRYFESSEELAPYKEKCRVIPLGIDLPEPDMGTDTSNNVDSKNRTIVAVGRLVPYKGFDVLIRAMRHVDAKLLLIGTGPRAAQLQALADSKEIREKVSFLGRVDDLRSYFQAASVFVLPSISRAEAFGIVQLEAMAAGLPVINTNIDSGVPEVSVDGETGLTVPPGDVKSLSNAIELLLDRNDLRERFGNAAKAKVYAEFSADLMASRTLSLYQQVLCE